MTNVSLFPFSEYWLFYTTFIFFVLCMLALDLGVFHRKAHDVKFKEALGWTVFWMSLGLFFCLGLYFYMLWKFPQDARLAPLLGANYAAVAKQTALEYLTGLIIEQALSVDNILVFVVIFKFFHISGQYQHRVLFFGILGSLVFRIMFISMGALLMKFQWVIWLFGILLLFTGGKLLFSSGAPIDPANNKMLKLLRRFLPITHEMHGQHFVVRNAGKLMVTPLFVTLAFIEMSDVVFAVDSVPAIFGITREPLVVFTSNVFAILGLRSMYFFMRGIVDRFHFLQYGLGLVLIFVGTKMIWLDHVFSGKFPILWSLGIVASIILSSILLSLVIPERHKAVEK